MSDQYFTVNIRAYLIAQLGENYALPKEKRIEGTVLLEFALETIAQMKFFLLTSVLLLLVLPFSSPFQFDYC